MLRFWVHFVPVFALSLWVGAGAGIGFIAAPVLFEKAGSRRQAGELVGHLLRRFDRYVFAFGFVAIAFTVLELWGSPMAGRTLTLKLGLMSSMLGLALFSRFAIHPEIAKLREAMGEDLERIPKEDPRRRRFGQLHGHSVLCLLAQLLLGAFALALSVMALLPKSEALTGP